MKYLRSEREKELSEFVWVRSALGFSFIFYNFLLIDAKLLAIDIELYSTSTYIPFHFSQTLPLRNKRFKTKG